MAVPVVIPEAPGPVYKLVGSLYPEDIVPAVYISVGAVYPEDIVPAVYISVGVVYPEVKVEEEKSSGLVKVEDTA